jgi:hypothetical protein
MKLDVTRDVVSDLWPLVRAGEASADSRSLVDAFLAADAAYAAQLKESEMMSGAVPTYRLSPGAERRLLDDARERARFKLLVIGGGIALAGFIALAAFVALMFFMGRG